MRAVFSLGNSQGSGAGVEVLLKVRPASSRTPSSSGNKSFIAEGGSEQCINTSAIYGSKYLVSGSL